MGHRSCGDERIRSPMALTQSIETARAERVGPEGVTAVAFDDALGRTGAALAWLRARHADGTLPLLRLPAARHDLASIGEAARRLTAHASDIVILGTGGSSLGGQTLAQLAGHGVPGLGLLRDGPRLHFMDNLDPATYGALLAKLPLAKTRFVAISKSGGTAETLMQTIAALAAAKDAGLEARILELFLGLTEPIKAGKHSGLRALLDAHGIAMLDQDPGVGGRFSVLSNVGLLPAAMLDLDIEAVRAGAHAALAPVLEGRQPAQVPAAVGAPLAVALAETRGKTITVVTVNAAGRGPRMAADLATLAGEPDFAGKTIGDLAAAEGRATAETLAKNGCPVRTIHVDRLDEATLGELLMHFMLETIIAAHLLGVDPFDQPAVEEGKVLAKRYLKGE